MHEKTEINTRTKITPEEAKELVQEGWKRADLHVHTSCSHDVLPAKAVHPETLYKKAKNLGLDFVTFTDHDTMKAHEILGQKTEDLIPGVEISITDLEHVGHTLHVNVFDLDFEEFEELETIAKQEQNIESFLSYLQKRDLPHIYNHPFWCPFGEQMNLRAVPELIKKIPVIEYNMQNIQQKNLSAMALARQYGKGFAATTDSHTGGIGTIYTMAKGENFREYFENIRKGKSVMVIEAGAWKYLTKELNAWIELIFNMNCQVRPEMDFSTGVHTADTLVKFFTSDGLREFPRLNHTAMRVMKRLSSSGLPTGMYIMAQETRLFANLS